VKRLALVLFVSLGLALVACDPSDQTPDDAGGHADSGDVVEADADAGGDAAPKTCEYQAGCSESEFCHDGVCKPAPECRNIRDWETCVEAFNAIEDDLGRRAVCRDTYCQLDCLLDSQCPDGQICSDHGSCIDFTGQITGEHPGGDARASLEAGVGNTLMTFPIGLSQGGYGSRASSNDGRYVESLKETNGQMHGLYTRAVVLDNGERQLIIVRLPIIFPTKALHEAVARNLQARTGKDWRDSLLISGTHTHSGPTRYWHLPDEAQLPLGTFGTDEFSQQVFDWMVESITSAANQALDDLSPAEFGWEIIESYDMDDAISSDRWEQTPPFDNNRLMLMRIDDPDGNPRAVLFSLGTHGTLHDSVYFTGDVLSGMERELEQRLGEDYDRFVPTMYLNENGGTMAPRGDQFDHGELQRYEAIGHHLADKAYDDIQNLETGTDIELEGVTHRFPMSYELLGYDPGEWTAARGGTINDQFDYGGIQCMGGEGDEDPETYVEPGNVGCIPVHWLGFHRPISIFARSQISAFNIDGLTVVTLPGEASMEVGWQVLRDAAEAWGIDPLESWVLGYAQDHQFYLTPTNLRGEMPVFPGITTPKAPDEYPDFTFSYLQGGYEASLNVWGWKMGDFMVARAVETIGMLMGNEPDNDLPDALPMEYSRIDEEPFPVEPSDASAVGTVTVDVSSPVERMTPIEFAWIGGDPGVEMPQAPKVTLERAEGANPFAPVKMPSTRDYTNRENRMLTRVREHEDGWEWVVYWEELADFPAGTYRFRVNGHHMDGDERTAYETTSSIFEIAGSDQLVVDVALQSGQIEGRLGYPEDTKLRIEGGSGDGGAVSGNFRMRHPEVPTGFSAPLVVGEDVDAEDVSIVIADSSGNTVAEVDGADITLENVEGTLGNRDDVPLTTFAAPVPSGVPSGDYMVTVTVTDAHGNTGTTTQTLTF
jgi:hypothetical protein